eukprot:c7377_g1_i1.p1 GENE.c7377_g1_i1~~c7377_g1_i1.p1  ORF type:complete len:459 (-),score=117.05 c7377_g1_i1:797-2128(-)
MHAYIRLSEKPIRFNPVDAEVFYDELNDNLIIFREGIFSVMTFGGDEIRLSYVNRDKHGDVSGVRCSPDMRFMSIRRSVHLMEIVDLHTLDTFLVTPKKKPCLILDCFWTRMETTDFVLATSSGLEFFKISRGEEAKAKMVKSYPISKAVWARFFAEENLLVIGGGTQANMIYLTQLTPTEVFKYPKFEVDMPNKNHVLSAKHITACRLYGVLYCLHTDVNTKFLVMYRVYKDLVARIAREIELFSTRVHVSLVDNVIVVHNLDTKVSMAYDVKVTRFPFMNPLPLAFHSSLPKPRPLSLSQGEMVINVNSSYLSPPDSPTAIELYKPDWRFMSPRTVIDTQDGYAWKVTLDLDEVAAACIEPAPLLGFLMHRSNAKRLVLSALQSMLVFNYNLSVIEAAFDLINTSYVAVVRQRDKDDKASTSKSGLFDKSFSDMTVQEQNM